MKMTEPLKLDIQTVCKNALKFYQEKRLTAQHPYVNQRRCLNFVKDDEYGEYRCAVAASYPDSWYGTFKAITWEAGISKGDIVCDKISDIGLIARVQYAHDKWAQYASGENTLGYNPEVCKSLEESFFNLIHSVMDA